MEDHPAYEYTPLATGSQIRLIKLLPGACHTNIEVEIFTTDLESPEAEAATKNKPNDETEEPYAWNRPPGASEHHQTHRTKTASDSPNTSKLKPLHLKGYGHKYDALSYTWGPDTNKVSILIKGERVDDTRSFLVTRNLGIALRYLRDTKSAKIFWIDALCINQADTKEKSRQVSMMTQIYRDANQVKIWLGPAADNSDMAMKELKNKNSTIDSITEENRQLRRSLESLARREYWTRVWVVQEIFVGSDVKIMCGTFEADWDSTAEAFKSFLNARDVLFKADTPPLPPSDYNRFSYAESNIWAPFRKDTIPSDPSRRLDDRPLKTITTLDTNRTFAVDERGPDWLLQMLLHLRHFGATDPRDKIFSMLGLLPSRAILSGEGYDLRANYERDFLEVSIQLFKYCFLAPRWGVMLQEPKLGRLNIISASQPGSNPGFPTWLPDFSKDNGMQPGPGLEGLGTCFSANLKISRDNLILSVRGIKVADLVAGTSSKDDCLATDDLSLLARLQQSVEKGSQYLHYSKDTSSRVWRSLVLNHDVGSKLSDYLYKRTDSFKEALSEIVPNVLSVDESLCSNQSESRSAQGISLCRAYLDMFRRQAYCRRFAVFQKSVDVRDLDGPDKFPAMVPQDGKVGDQLYWLGDCDHLVLLRRVANKKPCFNFVGPCHHSVPQSWIAFDLFFTGFPCEVDYIEIH